MLQEPSSAPRAIKVSIKTAVWIVMCKHPAIREPQVVVRLYERSAIKPGISASASSISFLPQAAREISFTLKATKGIVVVLIYSIFVIVNFLQNYAISFEIYTNFCNIYEMFKWLIF
jgi:hypothetical protein